MARVLQRIRPGAVVPVLPTRGAKDVRRRHPLRSCAKRNLLRISWLGLPTLLLLGIMPGRAVSATGLGVIAGEPTGISFKTWIDQRSAIDAAMAWSMDGDPDLHIHGDYLWHFFDPFPVERGQLPLYVGVGLRMRFDDDNDDDRFGVRIPVGIAVDILNGNEARMVTKI